MRADRGNQITSDLNNVNTKFLERFNSSQDYHARKSLDNDLSFSFRVLQELFVPMMISPNNQQSDGNYSSVAFSRQATGVKP